VQFGGLAHDFASFRIEGGVQRQGAMPVVLKSVAFGARRRERQHRTCAPPALDIRGPTLCAPRCGDQG